MGRPRNGIVFVRQPTKHSCGQTCVAMLTRRTVEEVMKACGTKGKTQTKHLVKALRLFGQTVPSRRVTHRGSYGDLPRDKTLLIVVAAKRVGRTVWRHWMIKKGSDLFDPGCGIYRSLPDDWIDAGVRVTSYLPIGVDDPPPIVSDAAARLLRRLLRDGTETKPKPEIVSELHRVGVGIQSEQCPREKRFWFLMDWNSQRRAEVLVKEYDRVHA